MDRYIGLDAHSESCTIAVMSKTGRKLRCSVLDTSADVLIDFLKGIAGERHLCLEDGQLAEWLVEVLGSHVDTIKVTQPERHTGQKTDEEDAWSLAEQIRVQARATYVFKPTRHLRELREAMRTYEVAVQDLVRAKNRLRALFRSRGVRELSDAIYDPMKRHEWIQMLHTAFRQRARWLGEHLDAMTRQHSIAQDELESIAKKHADVLRLATIPGIGLIRAATIVSIVVTPNRFPTRSKFWKYCGLGIVVHSSSDWEKTSNGSWSRRQKVQVRGLHPGNRLLKNVLKGAATSVIGMTNHPLRHHFDRMVAQGTPAHLARLTVARRIGAMALAMWKKKEGYQPSKYLAPPALASA